MDQNDCDAELPVQSFDSPGLIPATDFTAQQKVCKKMGCRQAVDGNEQENDPKRWRLPYILKILRITIDFNMACEIASRMDLSHSD